MYNFKDFQEYGSEAAVKEAGKYRQEGKNYVVQVRTSRQSALRTSTWIGMRCTSMLLSEHATVPRCCRAAVLAPRGGLG